MFPTFHLKWGPQYGSPSPSCQTHLLCSSESDVRTLVPGCEEWRKLCQNVVQHGLVSTHFNQVRMWKSVHIRFFCICGYLPPTPAIPSWDSRRTALNTTEHHWMNHKIYIYANSVTVFNMTGRDQALLVASDFLRPSARKLGKHLELRWSWGRFRYSGVQRSGATRADV